MHRPRSRAAAFQGPVDHTADDDILCDQLTEAETTTPPETWDTCSMTMAN